MSDRAVSNVVGYVLVFSLVVGIVGVLSGAGVGGLSDARTAERLQNTERAFDILAHNIADVYRRSAPSRGTEVQLGGGRIGPGPATTITVTVDDGATASTISRSYTPIRYESDDTTIAYSNTGVVRTGRSDEGAAFVRDPSFLLPSADAPNRTIVPVVATGGPSESVGGETTVLVRTAAVVRTVRNRTTGGATVTVEVETTEGRAAAWNRYIEGETPNSACTYPGADPSVVSCTFDTDQVVVVQTNVEVVIEE